MDSGFETIIYIILGIIFIVAQAARKKKQRANAPLPEEAVPEESVPRKARDFLEQLFDLDEATSVPREVVQTDPPPPAKAQPLFSEAPVSEAVSPFSGDVSRMETPYDMHENAITKNPDVPPVKRKNFDLRQAVIYSVILERKYF